MSLMMGLGLPERKTLTGGRSLYSNLTPWGRFSQHVLTWGGQCRTECSLPAPPLRTKVGPGGPTSVSHSAISCGASCPHLKFCWDGLAPQTHSILLLPPSPTPSQQGDRKGEWSPCQESRGWKGWGKRYFASLDLRKESSKEIAL